MRREGRRSFEDMNVAEEIEHRMDGARGEEKKGALGEIRSITWYIFKNGSHDLPIIKRAILKGPRQGSPDILISAPHRVADGKNARGPGNDAEKHVCVCAHTRTHTNTHTKPPFSVDVRMQIGEPGVIKGRDKMIRRDPVDLQRDRWRS